MNKQSKAGWRLALLAAFEQYMRPVGLLRGEDSERGQGTTEFGTIIAILVLIVVAAMALFREALLGLFQSLASRMGGF